MFIIVNHYIKEPDNFWSLVKEKSAAIPSNLTFHGVYPSTDMMRAVCVWEAENISSVEGFLNESFGDTVRNEYFEVNAEAAMGLPVQKMVASL